MDHKTWNIICTCGSFEHQVNFEYWEDNDEPPEKDLYMIIHLVDVPFWKRLWHGIAYIFGHKSRYGEFDEIILGKKHAKMFYQIADKLNQMPEEFPND